MRDCREEMTKFQKSTWWRLRMLRHKAWAHGEVIEFQKLATRNQSVVETLVDWQLNDLIIYRLELARFQANPNMKAFNPTRTSRKTTSCTLKIPMSKTVKSFRSKATLSRKKHFPVSRLIRKNEPQESQMKRLSMAGAGFIIHVFPSRPSPASRLQLAGAQEFPLLPTPRAFREARCLKRLWTRKTPWSWRT